MGWLTFFLGRQGTHFGLLLVNRTTRPLAGWWWLGPVVVVFAWIAVPVMRRCGGHNIMDGDDFSRATRFWWAPGWPWFGLVGAGLCLVSAPLLHPALARHWAPSAWFGLSMSISVPQMALAVLLGLAAIIWGMKLYIMAWVRVRQERYRAWQWRKGSRTRPAPHPTRLPKGCPFAEQCGSEDESTDYKPN